MKVYLLDTMTASALWDQGDADHKSVLGNAQRAAASGDVIAVSRITIAEIEYGYELYTSKDPARRSKAEANMRAFTLIKEISKGTTGPYSKIRAALFTKFAPRDSRNRVRSVRPERLIDKTTGAELGIQENDLWIAAIAVEYNMILVSDDRMRHIKDVWPSLRFVEWKKSPTPPTPPPATQPSSP